MVTLGVQRLLRIWHKVFYKAATDKKAQARYYNSFLDRMMVHTARAHPKLYIKFFNLGLKQMGKRKK